MTLIEHLAKIKSDLELLKPYLDSLTDPYAAHRSHFYNQAYLHTLGAIACLKRITEEIGPKEI